MPILLDMITSCLYLSLGYGFCPVLLLLPSPTSYMPLEEGARLLRRDPCARECDFQSAWCILQPPLEPLPAFEAPSFNELVLYELHVGSFVSEADESGHARG